MKINTKISISRDSKDIIHIRVQDASSCNDFIDVNISLENFTYAITGLSEVECSSEVKKLDTIGKYRVVEKRSIVCPLDTYDKNIFSQWLTDNCQEHGWELNTYLGSQNSVVYKNNSYILNYSVVKYVEEDTD